MSDDYKAMYREPSKPHQCMHYSDEDGTQCRATAMHNEHMCYHHRPDCILPVIENEPFLLENLDTREAIQHALGQVAQMIACNHMDFQKAKLLIQVITAAMRNLPPHPRPRTSTNPDGLHAKRREQHEVPVIPTEGDAFVATVEGPPHFARPTSTARTVPPPNPADSSADDAPPAPERDYNAQELDYFHHTIGATGFAPGNYPRPASVADDDIVNRANECRRRYSLPLLKPTRDSIGRLICNSRLDHARYL